MSSCFGAHADHIGRFDEVYVDVQAEHPDRVVHEGMEVVSVLPPELGPDGENLGRVDEVQVVIQAEHPENVTVNGAKNVRIDYA